MFVNLKKVSREGQNVLMKGSVYNIDALRWEAGVYQNFLPEIRRFLETHEGMTADIIDSCFVEYYGYKENEDESFLVLQDLSEKQCQVPPNMPRGNEFEEALLILQKRAELSIAVYSTRGEKTKYEAEPTDINLNPF